MLSEQTVDVYFWLNAASQFAYPSAQLPDCQSPKLHWFIRNGHNSLTASLLDCRNYPPPTLLIAILFPPVSGRSLIQASHFRWSCSIIVLSEYAYAIFLPKDVDGLLNLQLPCGVTEWGPSFCCLPIDLVSSLRDVVRYF
ncbi:unnamed protein product [Protopolystoma xenopodis]|uniref:Uncharacterized protein n=1 Tax=Protopolystoma xenopodis TaxID=117903 RepID=A0A448WHX5_9PLAT|nr:unnamed protein product [Protopolystoma xenopodis]